MARPLFSTFMTSMRAVTLTVAFAVVLGGCYMPVRYDAEIEISREGYYSMIFDGYLAKVPLYEEIRKDELTPQEEDERIDLFRRDLTDDPSMSDVEYIRQGIYKVHWEHEGDLLRDKYVTFIRRNENMLSIRFVKDDYTIRLAGKGLADSTKQQLVDIGLESTGELRVITNAKVVSENATSKRDWPDSGPGYVMYTWRLPSLYSPSPNFVISLR